MPPVPLPEQEQSTNSPNPGTGLQPNYGQWRNANTAGGVAPFGPRPKPDKPLLGNSTRCCCFIWTRDSKNSIFLAFFVLFPVVVFNTSVVPSSEWWSWLITGVLAALDLIILVCAVGIDPGIVPPSSATGRAYNPNEVVTMTYEGQLVQVPVCGTCLVPRPPRSSHCPTCDYCVEEYDHHCGVLGSCVAKRTFRFFAYFFDVTTLLAGYVFVRSIIAAKDFDWDKSGDSDWTRWNSVAIIGCIIYTAFAGCCVCGQATFYTKLACDGVTQKDLYGRQGVAARKAAVNAGMEAPSETTAALVNTPNMSCGNYCTRKCAPLPQSQVAIYLV